MPGMWRVTALVAVAGAVGCGASSGPLAGGGTATLSIGDAAGSNVTPSVPPITVVLGYAGLEVGALSYEHQPSVDVKRWQLLVGFGATPATGQIFTIASRQMLIGHPMTASMDIEELPAAGAFREWSGVGGSIAVASRVGARVTLTFAGVPFQPVPGDSGNEATGMFTLTGQLTVDNISQPLPTD